MGTDDLHQRRDSDSARRYLEERLRRHRAPSSCDAEDFPQESAAVLVLLDGRLKLTYRPLDDLASHVDRHAAAALFASRANILVLVAALASRAQEPLPAGLGVDVLVRRPVARRDAVPRRAVHAGE